MKLMIASDIHGSAYYCKKMLDRFDAEQTEKLLLLGDLLYHGPRNDLPREYAPKSVIAQLNAVKEKLLCVRGNCDTEVDQMVLDFPILADYCVLFAAGRRIYATHGHLYGGGAQLPLQSGDILLQGHTHIPLCAKDGGILRLNPGSVSIPKENSPHGYLLLTDSLLEWKTLDGEIWMTGSYAG